MPIAKDSVLGQGILGLSRGAGGTRSLKDMIDYANNTGRLVVMYAGDSTARHNSLGLAAATFNALNSWVPQCGYVFPPNTSAAYNANGDGTWGARRRDNASVVCGLASALPAAWDGYYIPYAAGWLGPQPALLGRTELTVDPGAGGTTLTVTSTAEFPSSGRVQCENELIQYTGITGTTFTGCTRGSVASTAAAHAINSVVTYLPFSSTGWQWNIDLRSGMNANCNVAQVLFYYVNGATVSYSNWPLRYSSMAEFIQTGTITTVDDDAGPNMTGSPAIGSNYYVGTHGASSTLDGLCMVSGAVQWPGGAYAGPRGPGFVRGTAFINKDLPTGWIQTQGISQGGKQLTQMLSEFMNTANSKAGLAKYLWDYAAFRETDTGGNGSSKLAVFNYWGHNESGSTTLSSFVDPTVDWTIATSGLQVTNDTGATIVFNNSTNLNSTADGGGHVLIGSERIKYTTLTGTTIGGLTRQFAGTASGGTYANGTPAYGGWRPCHPDGIATDLLYWYNILKTAWTSNPKAGTFVESDIYFIYVRPMPIFDTATVVADNSPMTTEATKEYKFRQYAEAVSRRLAPIIPGFILVDPANETTRAEINLADWYNDAGDAVHNSFPGYNTALGRAFSTHMRGFGSRSSSL